MNIKQSPSNHFLLLGIRDWPHVSMLQLRDGAPRRRGRRPDAILPILPRNSSQRQVADIEHEATHTKEREEGRLRRRAGRVSARTWRGNFRAGARVFLRCRRAFGGERSFGCIRAKRVRAWLRAGTTGLWRPATWQVPVATFSYRDLSGPFPIAALCAARVGSGTHAYVDRLLLCPVGSDRRRLVRLSGRRRHVRA